LRLAIAQERRMPLNILLIEDEPDIQTVVRLVLEATGGQRVGIVLSSRTMDYGVWKSRELSGQT